MRLGVVLAAGGAGTRFGGPLPKQFLEVRPGRPLLQYPLETFHAIPEVESIALTLPAERIPDWKNLLEMFPKLSLVAGGPDRWLSVRNGVASLPEELDAVFIHDAARPYTPHSVIHRCIQILETRTAVTAALLSTDTVKEVDGKKILRTLERNRLVMTQTPQAFPTAMLKAIYARGIEEGTRPTDELQLAEAAGFPVVWAQGSVLSRKITEPEDWEWAEWVAERLELGEITLDD
jgi:2-C-methyl-D-erythritol 4-phosphate cytidylyltransferase